MAWEKITQVLLPKPVEQCFASCTELNHGERGEDVASEYMKQALADGTLRDLSRAPRTSDGSYRLFQFEEDKDYCNVETEIFIWSIGKHKETGRILAAEDTRYYGHPEYDCLWLR